MRCRRAFVLAVSLLFAAPAGAAILHVRADAPGPAHDGTSWATAFPTIQPALDAAQPDDEVWVARGTYPGGPTLRSNVSLYGGFAGNEATREGRAIRENPTVLDGGGSGPVVYIPSELHDITLDGFTITNGRVSDNGAGIRCLGRNITLSHNFIENNVAEYFDINHAYTDGAGIRLSGGPVTVSNNVIRSNRAIAIIIPSPLFLPYGGASGGGIEAVDAQVRIVNNLFVGNVALMAGYGAVYMEGAALSAWRVSGLVANNTFAENVGTMDPYWKSLPSGAAPEAVFVRECRDDLGIVNNVFAYNTMGMAQKTSGVVLRHNAFFANTKGNVSGLPDPVGSNGNISADPFFVDRTGGDYRLSVGSPLIDAGDGSVILPGQTDLGGNPRVLGAHVDIGAYEFVPASGLTLGHAAWALRVAAGLADCTPSDMATLDMAGDSGSLDLRDAIALARRIAE